MTQYLFLFTIGPVQSFIAQARKTHDLRAGSFLLSQLVDSTMEKLSKLVDNPEILFPHKKIKYKPNRFLVKIETKSPEKIGKNLETFVKEEFEKISREILHKEGITTKVDFKKKCEEPFKKQITTFLQVFWVIIPIRKQTYAETYVNLERYLGATKNIRSFKQLNEIGDWGRKCSLCGERSALFYREKRRYHSPFAIPLTNLSIKFFNEDLCAICFTKRFINSHFKTDELRDYPSTAEISLMDTLNKLGPKLSPFKGLFGKNFDHQLYFEENLNKRAFELNDLPFEKKERAKEQLEKIKKTAKVEGLQFPRYYALIMFDGDDMGKWLSGAYLKDSKLLPDFHNNMSKTLGNFAEKVEKIITEKKGRLIYAGGDDILAFINLNHLLPVLKELRAEFPNFGKLAATSNNQISTPSCGVCIAHYKTPLSTVRNWSKKMEVKAKELKGKDAIGFAYLRHSGAITKSVFKWNCNVYSTVETFEELTKLLKKDVFSNTFIRKLADEFRHLMDKEGIYEEKELIETELKRLITRAYMKKKGKESREEFEKEKKNQIKSLTKRLMVLYNNSQSLENFLGFLEIILLIEGGLN